jgi:structural maintenance of chromosome 2
MQTEHSMQPDTSGLNGSGKSNILDAICFVLGISNLTQVRGGNLSELVYKQGQAGVTKASVTIVFNNEDKQNSPVGQLGSLDYYSILYS